MTNKTIEELRAELAAAEAAERERAQQERQAKEEEERQKRKEAELKKAEAEANRQRSVLESVAQWIENNTKLKCTVNAGVSAATGYTYTNIDVTDGEMKRQYGFSFKRQYTGRGWSSSREGKEYIRLQSTNFINKKVGGFDIRAMAELICNKFDRAKLEEAANNKSINAENEKRRAVATLRKQYNTGGDSDWYWDDLGTGVKFSHSAAGAEVSLTFTCRGDAETLVAFYNSFVKEGRIVPKVKSNG